MLSDRIFVELQSINHTPSSTLKTLQYYIALANRIHTGTGRSEMEDWAFDELIL